VYGVLKQNVFIVVGNAPGLLMSFWLNMQAAKLQYEGFRSQEMVKSLVAALEQPQAAMPEVDNGDRLSESDATRAIRIIRDVEIQAMKPPVSQDVLFMFNLVVWMVIISIVSFASVFSDQAKELLVGVTVNLNLVVFYASPLSVIWAVLSSRSSAKIHIPTMMGGFLNGTFWAAYGVAVLDAFIAVPNALGALLGVIQIVLCVIFPRKAKPAVGAVECVVQDRTSLSDLPLDADNRAQP
jgi:solute carrier family 50 (sugar transporter)